MVRGCQRSLLPYPMAGETTSYGASAVLTVLRDPLKHQGALPRPSSGRHILLPSPSVPEPLLYVGVSDSVLCRQFPCTQN